MNYLNRVQEAQHILDAFYGMTDFEVQATTRKARRIQYKNAEKVLAQELSEFSPGLSSKLTELDNLLDKEYNEQLRRELD